MVVSTTGAGTVLGSSVDAAGIAGVSLADGALNHLAPHLLTVHLAGLGVGFVAGADVGALVDPATTPTDYDG
jgi:hypothetical protein